MGIISKGYTFTGVSINITTYHNPSIRIMKAQIVTSLLLLLLATYATAQKAESGEKEEFSGEESLDVTEIAQDKVEAEEEGQFTEVEELRSSEDDRQGNEKQKLKDRIKALTNRKNNRCRSSRRSKTCKARYDLKIKKLNDKLLDYLTPAEIWKEDWLRLKVLKTKSRIKWGKSSGHSAEVVVKGDYPR